MSEQQNQNEAACGGSALTVELGNELPGKNARAMLPLLEELAERDAEIERLRSIVERASRLEGLYHNTHLNQEGFRLTIEGIAQDAKAALAVPNAEVRRPPITI